MTEAKLLKLSDVVIAAATFSSIIGILQWLYWRFTGVVVIGSDYMKQAFELAPWGGLVFAANGLARNANHFGAMIAWTCPFAFFLSLSRTTDPLRRRLYFIASGIGVYKIMKGFECIYKFTTIIIYITL